jgi:acetyl-CoA C-acetyltransferase
MRAGTDGYGPIYAVRSAIARIREKFGKEVDLMELDEAFAAPSLACLKELSLDPAIVNFNVGAIALGPPIGCSATRIVVILLYEMQKRQAAVGLAALCVGGGMRFAKIVERGWYF